jgi:hypothetical protein
MHDEIKSSSDDGNRTGITFNSKDVTDILEKVSQLVKRSQELGFEMKELEIKSENGKRDSGSEKE